MSAPYRTHETRAIIQHLGAAANLRGVPELLPYLPPHTHDLGEDAANALDTIMRTATPLALASFDAWFRSDRAIYFPSALPPDFRNIVIGSPSWDPEKYRAVVALATFHENGRTRETALEMICTRE